MKGLKVMLVPLKLPFGWLRLLALSEPLTFRLTEVNSNAAASGGGGDC
jgi:hypothetical protein